MAAAELGRLLRWYPPAWRDRYGEEFLVYMQDSFGSERPPWSARLSVVAGGIRERARRSGLTGDSVPPPDRVRAGVLLVLVSWTAMVIAGSGLAKMSEHFDTALRDGAGAHHFPDLSYTVIQTVAGIAGLIVIAGAGLALPAFLRYLRSGGWSSIRPHALRAAACTVATAVVTVPLLVWAHHLTSDQRNGGSTAYTTVFLIWAALVAVTLALWTGLAVAAARKVSFSRSVLTAEAGMAVAVAFAIVGILTATTVWWATVAERAPAFLSGSHSSLDARLVATVTLMALAGAAATAGAIRIVRCLPSSLHS
jgi:hypothetical protein